MKSELRPHAVMCVEGEVARICAWCPDKLDADAWAEARGLLTSHGICEACKAQLCTDVVFEAGERCAAPGETSLAAVSTPTGAPARLVVFSCRRGGATS